MAERWFYFLSKAGCQVNKLAEMHRGAHAMILTAASSFTLPKCFCGRRKSVDLLKQVKFVFLVEGNVSNSPISKVF